MMIKVKGWRRKMMMMRRWREYKKGLLGRRERRKKQNTFLPLLLLLFLLLFLLETMMMIISRKRRRRKRRKRRKRRRRIFYKISSRIRHLPALILYLLIYLLLLLLLLLRFLLFSHYKYHFTFWQRKINCLCYSFFNISNELPLVCHFDHFTFCVMNECCSGSWKNQGNKRKRVMRQRKKIQKKTENYLTCERFQWHFWKYFLLLPTRSVFVFVSIVFVKSI